LDLNVLIMIVIVIKSICCRTVDNVELEASIDEDSAMLRRTVTLGSVIHHI